MIIGISRRKVHIWLLSIVMILIALVFGVTGIYNGVRNFLSNSGISTGKEFFHHWQENRGREAKITNFVDEIPIENYTDSTNGCFVNDQGEQEIVKIISTKRLSGKGIILYDQDVIVENTSPGNDVVYLNLRFNRPFRGYLNLMAFDENRRGITKSTLQFDINDTLDLRVEFFLENEFSLQDVDYWTLTSENI